jgi:integrase
MDAAPSNTAPSHQEILFRDGLIIALLICVPLRIKNLAALTINDTLVSCKETWTISLKPEHTKTHRHYEIAWPEALVPHLERYLDVYRPRLARRRRVSKLAAGESLWVSAEGRPLSAKRINCAIKLRTNAAFGFAVNPHLFRDICATTTATQAPGDVGIIPAILGHASPATAERHYQQASSMQAQRTYSKHLAKLKKGEA